MCGGFSVTKSGIQAEAELCWVNCWLGKGTPSCVPKGQAGVDLRGGLQKGFGRSSPSSCTLVASGLGGD